MAEDPKVIHLSEVKKQIEEGSSPREALQSALEDCDQLQFESVLIVAMTDDSTVLYTSQISAIEANWMCDEAKDFIRRDHY